MTPRADRPGSEEISEAAVIAAHACLPGEVRGNVWSALEAAYAVDVAPLLARVAELEAMNQAGDHDMRALAQLGIDAHAEWEAERDALRAANARLRDALQRVVALGHDVTGEISNEACAGCIAVDALSDAPKAGLPERLERVRRWRPGELCMVRNIEGEWVLLDEVRAALAQDDVPQGGDTK